MNIDNYTVSRSCSIKLALEKVEKNKNGAIFIENDDKQIIGLATDGDIRRKILEGIELDDIIDKCGNKDFVWVTDDTPREQVLKQLDHTIRLIPVLDTDRRLLKVVTRDHFPWLEQQSVFARSRSPVRVSFGGGGSDVTYYFRENQGAVINATISMYSHAIMRPRKDEKIIIHSADLNESIEANSLPEFLAAKTNLKLFQAIIRAIQPEFGFELRVYSDFPTGSGLGGSSALSASVIGCFNQFRHDKWERYEIAELAFQAERLYLGISGGWQDQYATAFGGFNFMEFHRDQNIVHPLRLPENVLNELQESIILCDTNTTRNSGNIHDDQKIQMASKDLKDLVRTNVDLTYEMRNHLLRGRLYKFASLLDEAWNIKRRFSKQISNSEIDLLYSEAKKHGVLGGKLLGAGGGGFFLFFVPPFERVAVSEWLRSTGFKTKRFSFEPGGLQSWTVREEKE